MNRTLVQFLKDAVLVLKTSKFHETMGVYFLLFKIVNIFVVGWPLYFSEMPDFYIFLIAYLHALREYRGD